MDLQILSMSTPLSPLPLSKAGQPISRSGQAGGLMRPLGRRRRRRSVGLSFGIVISGRTRIDFVAEIAATHLLRKGIGATTAVVTW